MAPPPQLSRPPPPRPVLSNNSFQWMAPPPARAAAMAPPHVRYSQPMCPPQSRGYNGVYAARREPSLQRTYSSSQNHNNAAPKRSHENTFSSLDESRPADSNKRSRVEVKAESTSNNSLPQREENNQRLRIPIAVPRAPAAAENPRVSAKAEPEQVPPCVAVKAEPDDEWQVITIDDDSDDEMPHVKTEDNHTPRVTAKSEPKESEILSISDDTEEDKEALDTHIIFVVDFSSSMNLKDVKTKHGKISRWNAVFQCLNELVDDQLANDGGGNAVVSFVIFNDRAETLLEKMPLVGDGAKVRKALKTAQLAYKPKGGTGFAAGLGRAKELATGGNGNLMLVFLSDGRPGDLQPNPPVNSSTPMQDTFRRNKKQYPAAGVHIEAMKEEFQGRLNLQLVGLSSEGKKWLQYLGKRYEGTFNMPNMSMDDDNSSAPLDVASAPYDNDEDEEEDEVMDIKIKSQDTLLRERFNRARAAGHVHSIPSSSIRATFQSISSAVTSMRNGASRKPLQERQIVMEKNGARSQMRSFPATRMVLKPNGTGLQNAAGEKSNQRIVQISTQPFAQGGLRNVFRMKEGGQAGKVGKESRHEIDDKERCKFHVETSRCQARAAEYADKFNIEVKRKRIAGVGTIKVLCAEVYRLQDPDFPRGYRYLHVEQELDGKYEKYNNNNGYVLESDAAECKVAQAFSHFSYHVSNKVEMVVDIQGSGFTYTDPQIHSTTKEYGRADRGENGFNDFLASHKCNYICRGLGLKFHA